MCSQLAGYASDDLLSVPEGLSGLLPALKKAAGNEESTATPLASGTSELSAKDDASSEEKGKTKEANVEQAKPVEETTDRLAKGRPVRSLSPRGADAQHR